MTGCDSCTREGRRGYCAPHRCYCGHKDCHAAASYYNPKLPEPACRPHANAGHDPKDQE